MSIVWSLLVVVLAAGPVAAQDRLDAAAVAVDRATAPPTAESAAVERMARFLNTTPDALRAERASTRLGWGDVFIANRIASRGGHPIAKVFAARRTGAAWGAIAEEARVESDALLLDVAALWPDASRTGAAGDAKPAPGVGPAPSSAPEDKKGLGDRLRDFLRGGPADDRTRDDKPIDRTEEEIRDRMIRGGGRR